MMEQSVPTVSYTHLQKAPVENTFLLADIEQYGFTAPFQQVWAMWRGGLPAAVYLRFYQNLLIDVYKRQHYGMEVEMEKQKDYTACSLYKVHEVQP